MKKQLKFFILTVIGIAVTAIVVLGVLVWQGVILLNNPSSEQYPVRGVDVSSYQGEIDWDVLASQDLSLIHILRANMDSLKTHSPIPFEKELDHVMNYLYLCLLYTSYPSCKRRSTNSRRKL